MNFSTLMPLGYKIHMWNNLNSGVLMAASIILVHLITIALTFRKDAQLTKQINEKLKQIQIESDSE